MPTRTVDPSRFSMVPRNDVPRSAIDIKFSHKTTFQGGLLVPVYVDEVLPGDSLRLSMDAFARLATPIVPPMDNLWLESFFFYCPNRILWANWERFMGEQVSPGDSTAFLVPQVVIANATAIPGTIYNSMGLIDPAVGQTYSVSAMPLRAYAQIFNDWFRDQDIDNLISADTDDGPDAVGDYALQFRRRRHDYFSTARPWPQKPSMSAITPSSPILSPPGFDMGTTTMEMTGQTSGGAGAPVSGIGVTALGPIVGPANLAESGNRTTAYQEYYSDAVADIRIRASPANDYPDVRVFISDIRTANQCQLFMERNARGGSRYAELVRAHFGVVSPDSRLQRPEYLGGGRTMVHIAPVAQTSETTGTNFLGEQAGIATAVASDHGFSASFTEHGWIIGLVNVRTDMTYQRGVNRMWFRRTVFDHYFPAWAHLAEQPILSREIWVDGNAADETTVWGYQERWAEYRWKPGMVTGQFSSMAGTPLDMWHFAPNWTARPVLNTTWLVDDPPLDRVLQVAAFLNQEILFDSAFKCRWVRPLPMFSIPGLGGRF